MDAVWNWLKKQIDAAVEARFAQERITVANTAMRIQNLDKAIREFETRVDQLNTQISTAQHELSESVHLCESYALLCSSTKDADEVRWNELAKKVDGFGATFKQLGILIANQPITEPPASSSRTAGTPHAR